VIPSVNEVCGLFALSVIHN